ncbi:MAG TPA: hypothetical protein VHD56_06015 [Tepidisphaeraceae bacterium]|nr:hypothetical protein [Tepidisphaeraceae bacterium]
MTQRIAAALSLIVFAVCVMAGTSAGNPFTTVLSRALLAMAMTMVIGLVIGSMAQKMLDENVKVQEEKLKNHAARMPEDGR